MVDFSGDFGARARQRLEQAAVAWLVTVGGDGTPQPSPVWFLWDGESCLIYSQPDKPKVRNVQRHPQAALHFDGDDQGGNIVILTGTAAVVDAPPAGDNTAYLDKYTGGIADIGMTVESFAASYSVPIRFTPAKLRGF